MTPANVEGAVVQLLNAKPENVERESEIVAQSGRSQAVTIATNMAGRGTDIILGGNPEYMARSVQFVYGFIVMSHAINRILSQMSRNLFCRYITLN